MAKEVSIKCVTPQRVTLEELERIRAEDAERRRAALPLVECSAAASSTLAGELLDAHR
jgi:hypothetical protein